MRIMYLSASPYLWLACSIVLAESISESQVKNYASTFKQTLDKHLEEKLALTQLRQMIKDHEKELGIRKIDGLKEFQRIFQNIQLRFTGLELSVGNLKSAVEKNFNGQGHGTPGGSNPAPPGPLPPPIAGPSGLPVPPAGDAPQAPPNLQPPSGNIGPPPISGAGPNIVPGNGPPVRLRHCCKDSGLLKYSGRFREKVFLQECYENIDDQLDIVRSSGIVDKMKLNSTPGGSNPAPPGPSPPPLAGPSSPPVPPAGDAPQPPPNLGPPSGNVGPPPISGSGPKIAPGNGPPVRLRHCCKDSGLLKYSGRFREKVFLEECYENIDNQLDIVRSSGIIDRMKENLLKDSSLTWQYFASTRGHYIQYPTNNRACDQKSPSLNSPLTQEWFVEKLRHERKNLVILVDNGLATQASSAPGSPVIHKNLLIEAVEGILHTLTSDDKVNLVIFPYGNNVTGVTSDCNNNLLVATQSNINLLLDFMKTSPKSNAQSNLMEGLDTAYSLFEKEQQENKATFDRHSNMLMVIMDGKSTPSGLTGTPIFELMARYQQKLGASLQHFVYLLGEPVSDDLTNKMAQIADQNNLKLTLDSGVIASKWPAIPSLVSDGQPVGKEGHLMIIRNISTFPLQASTYFEKIPPKLDNTNDITTITPIMDGTSGIKMSLAALVYNNTEVMGVAAADATLSTVFTEIDNFDVGQNSYMYLLELNHGHVLMHPKLRDPDETRFDDTIFPRLEMLEPELSVQERLMVRNASTMLGHFNTTQLTRVRNFVSGEVLLDPLKTPTPATVYYQRLKGTYLCVVLVHFATDIEEARLEVGHRVTQAPLHAPYHRIDQTVLSPFPNKPDKDMVCHLYNNFVSFQESVIKLSPSVFAVPEHYKYKVETIQDISEINSFLIKGGDTKLIREDTKALIQQTIRATNDLDSLWLQSSKDVIDRFYGSTSGVFRLYPGLPLQNSYDHMKTDWYQRSIAFPNTTFYHYGKLTGVTRNQVIIVSRAITEQGRLQGVVGLIVTARYFTSQLLNSVDGCLGKGLTCHIVDASGYILDNRHDNTKSHLSEKYPWLVAELLAKQNIKMDWCTAFSDGYHKQIYLLVQKLVSDSSASDKCQHYRLEPVTGSNLFLLILEDRQQNGCKDTVQVCSNCGASRYNPRYQFSLPQCKTCNYNTTQCQCPCYCMTDFDVCHGQFKTGIKDFPTASCFNSPLVESQPELQPESPGPMFEHCTIPCAAIEDLVACHNLSHCKLSSDPYPVCIWKDKDELKSVTESKFLPTTPPPTPPAISTQSSLNAPHPITKGPPKPPGLTTNGVGPPILATSVKIPKPASLSTKVPVPVSLATTIKGPKPIHLSTKGPPVSQTSNTGGGPPPPITTKKTPTTNTDTTVSLQSTDSSTRNSSKTGSTLLSVTTNLAPSSTPIPQIQAGTNNSLTSPERKESSGMSGGQIAGLTIGLLALAVISAFLVFRIYGKKFRRPGAADSSKYMPGSSLFNSSFFNRSTEEVTLNTAPSSTVEYKEMTNGEGNL